MDPNLALSQLREVIRLKHDLRLIEDGHTLDYVLERIEAIDDWLSTGGFLPDDWERYKREH